MKADRDDMPDYLKPRKKEGPWKMLAIMSASGLVIWGLASVFGKHLEGQQPQGRLTITGDEERRSSYPARTPETSNQHRYQQQMQRPNDDVLIIDRGAGATPEVAPEKQTVFHDQNYTPKGAVNVVSYPTAMEPPKVSIQAKPQEIIIVGVQDDRAERVCSSGYRDGSVEKRNCKAQVNLSLRNSNQ